MRFSKRASIAIFVAVLSTTTASADQCEKLGATYRALEYYVAASPAPESVLPLADEIVADALEKGDSNAVEVVCWTLVRDLYRNDIPYESMRDSQCPSDVADKVLEDFQANLAIQNDQNIEDYLPLVRIPARSPLGAKKRRVNGAFIVEFDILEDGLTQPKRVVASSHKMFNREAMRTAGKQKFVPRKVGGTPVRVEGVWMFFRVQQPGQDELITGADECETESP
ncbi:MAG: TonB family protein [Pseudomonadota bacterium]